ncbi:MAG: sialidase family protein [Actinomycetota bacterium]
MTSTRTRRSVALSCLIALVALALSMSTPVPADASGKSTKDGSGGTAIAHQAGAKKVASKDAPDARLSRLGVTSGEPTVGVANNGWVYTSAFQTNTRVLVMRSKDRGKTWEDVSPNIGGRNTHTLSLDPYTWVDNRLGDKDRSRIFTIDLTVDCSFASFSDDGGESWITNPLACGRPVNDHQTFFGGPPKSSTTVGYPNVLYYCWNDVASSSCGKSLDGGLTWIPAGTPAYTGVNPDDGDFCGGLHGHGYVDDKGNVYLPREYCEKASLAISRDEGVTWEDVLVDKKVGHIGGADPSVVVDKGGNIYYLWIGLDRLPYLAVSKDGGESWSKAMMVAPPGVNEANLPSIDVGDNGKIALTYMGTENSPNKPMKGDCGGENPPCPQQADYKDTTWHGYMTISTNALDANPVFYTTTVNDTKDPLLRGTCGPGRCSGRVPGILDFIDIVIDPDGFVWGAYVDECTTICVTGGGNMGAEGVIGTLVGGPKLR